MQQLSEWFPLIGQMPDSLKAFVGIASATLVAGVVVGFVVIRSRKNARENHHAE